MDPKAEIRDFLTSRRARITPEEAGLPVYGSNRRVEGLRREEVSMLAGISVEYYVRLERGNLGSVSREALDGIARALQLDEAERAHLYTWHARPVQQGPPGDNRHRNGCGRACNASSIRSSVRPLSSSTPAPTFSRPANSGKRSSAN